ncbi:MAG TPA: hypothetical protein VLD67_03190 [Vicinamibacterales bacterium]|nr:hypothetical protein [Vicinamibacterales bacterium]
MRTAAVILALAATLDPSYVRERGGTARVDLVVLPDAGSGTRSAAREAAERVRARVRETLRGRVSFDSPEATAGVVFVGDAVPAEAVRGNVPASVVVVHATDQPNVRLLTVSLPPDPIAGRATEVTAVIQADGMAGTTSVVTLEHAGAVLSRSSHRWTLDAERAEVRLACMAPSPGVRALTVVVQPLEGEATAADNRMSLLASADARRLKIFVLEPRPSWAVAFIRRALEADPLFDVTALSQLSQEIAVRAGGPPRMLSLDRLSPYDLVLVGAPEGLRAADVGALASFARVRGGAVVLVADRRPSGPYISLVPSGGFDEVLLAVPAVLDGGSAGRLRAAELVVPKALLPGAMALASLERNGNSSGVVIAAPLGDGRVIFSGVLDAWRYRADEDGYAAFWRAQVAAAASSAPRRLQLFVDSAFVAPGRRIRLRATLRRTEFHERNGRVDVPSVDARIMDASGLVQPVRLWPDTVPGVFEGEWEASAPGRYEVQVTAGTDLVRDTVVVVDPRAEAGAAADPGSPALVAEATGGVAVTAADLAPLEQWLRSLPRPRERVEFHPARSFWWMLATVALLCAEWTIRRRRAEA